MDSPSISDIVGSGLVPDPNNHPTRVIIEYSSGATITLQDDILIDWWREYIGAQALMRQIRSASQVEPYSMKSVRRSINPDKPFRSRVKSEGSEE